MVSTCFADDIAASFRNDLEEAETLLQDITRQNRTPNAAELAFFARLAWDQRKIGDNLRRVNQAMAQSAIAGTPADREAAETEEKISIEIAEKEVPKHRAKAEEHTSKADAYERAARLASKKVEQHRESKMKCREFAPLADRQKVDEAKSILNTQGVGADLRAAKSRHQELVCVLNVGGVYDSPAKHIEYALRRNLPEAVTKTVDGGGMIRLAYSPEWPALKSAAEVEFAELNSKLPELQAAYDAELFEIEKGLDFYSNPQAID